MKYELAAFMQRVLLRYDLVQWAKMAIRVFGACFRDPYQHNFLPDFAKNRGVRVSTFSIETQAYCNRSCEFCPRHLEFERPYRVDDSGNKMQYRIPMRRLEQLLDEISDLASSSRVTISPIGLNEPFEDERVLQFLKSVKAHDFIMYMVSNGDVIEKNPDLFKQCLPYIDVIKFGVYYDFTTALGQRLISERTSFLKKVMTQFMNEQNRLIPVEFSVASRKFWHPNTYLFKGRAIRYPCFLQADVGAYYINARGDVTICCREVVSDQEDSLCIGNIFRASLREILYSSKHKDVLTDLYSGRRHKYARCSCCVYSIGVSPRIASAQDVSYYRAKMLNLNPQNEMRKLLNRYNRWPFFRGEVYARVDPTGHELPAEVEVFNLETNKWLSTKM